MTYDTARDFMIRVYDANMTNGDYVYILLGTDEFDLYRNKLKPHIWLYGMDPVLNNRTCELRDALESLMILTAKFPDLPINFQERIKEANRRPPFNINRSVTEVSTLLTI